MSFYCWQRNFGKVFTAPLPNNNHMRYSMLQQVIHIVTTGLWSANPISEYHGNTMNSKKQITYQRIHLASREIAQPVKWLVMCWTQRLQIPSEPWYSSLHHDNDSKVQPALYFLMGTLLREEMQLERGAAHLLPTSCKVQNGCRITFICTFLCKRKVAYTTCSCGYDPPQFMWFINDLSSEVGNKSRILYHKKYCAILKHHSLSKFAVLYISVMPFSHIHGKHMAANGMTWLGLNEQVMWAVGHLACVPKVCHSNCCKESEWSYSHAVCSDYRRGLDWWMDLLTIYRS
jgi:hypothetical protein